MKLIKPVFATLVFIFALSAMTFAQTPEELYKDELGIKRLKIVFPEQNSTIENTNPMITIDASALEAAVDPQTVIITLDGSEVTKYADVTSAYFIYQPAAPLAPGSHEIRVVAKDINKNEIEPLSWKFNIAGAVKKPSIKEKPVTNGTFSLSADIVDSDYDETVPVDVPSLFGEKDGTKINTDLRFSNIDSLRSITGSFHRETTYFTDTTIDKGRLIYEQENVSASLGYFWHGISELSMIGTELGGALFQIDSGEWQFDIFSGRTQDPSTSGTYKQNTTGGKASFAWDEKNTSSLVFLSADEKDNPLVTTLSNPAKDRIASFIHEYKHSSRLSATMEAATNKRTVDGADSENSKAAKLRIDGSFDDGSASVSVYKIGEAFMPVSEGNSKFLKNDREGYSASANYTLMEMFTLGGEHEEYDKRSTDLTTRRSTGYLSVLGHRNNRFTWRRSKLSASGTVSESDSLSALFLIEPNENLSNTRLSVNLQNIDYSAAGILNETKVFLFAVNTIFQESARLGISYSQTESEDFINLTDSKNKTTITDINSDVMQKPLSWFARFEFSDNFGTGVDNEERRTELGVKQRFRADFAVSLSWQGNSYKDGAAPLLNYDQNIYRIGSEFSF
ncbi:MAG TPA: hypothetical protein PLN69_04770 [bacterium]|nr:hypothetical protein [bacterium]